MRTHGGGSLDGFDIQKSGFLGPFHLHERRIEPALNAIDGVRIDSKAMAVLVHLAEAAPEIIEHATILECVWPHVIVCDNVLYQAIAHLRKALGDDARSPRYIENVPRRGYRLLMPVHRSRPEGSQAQPSSTSLELGQAGTLSEPSTPLLAVLPFDSLSGDANLLRFSEGLAEEVLVRVARAARIRVIGRTASFRLRGADKSLDYVAGVLRATHALDGAVRSCGQRIRAWVQLVDCSSRSVLWSDEFEFDDAESFALQDEIADVISRELHLAMAPMLERGT